MHGSGTMLYFVKNISFKKYQEKVSVQLFFHKDGFGVNLLKKIDVPLNKVTEKVSRHYSF